jgi:hypothetical protein
VGAWRWSLGAGIILPTFFGRFEANYVHVLTAQVRMSACLLVACYISRLQRRQVLCSPRVVVTEANTSSTELTPHTTCLHTDPPASCCCRSMIASSEGCNWALLHPCLRDHASLAADQQMLKI